MMSIPSDLWILQRYVNIILTYSESLTAYAVPNIAAHDAPHEGAAHQD